MKINIIDTPGHADFGGEVERILMMVDGVLLLVDAFEGVMPQTRFVLHKALSMDKRIVVVVNKIDRPGARPAEVVDEIIELFIELNANDDQLDFPVVYASARDGVASLQAEQRERSRAAVQDHCRAHPCAAGRPDGPFQLLFSNIDYNDYVGRIGVGRIERGRVHRGDNATLCRADGTQRAVKITRLYQFEGLKRVEVEQAEMGDIVAVAGIADLNIGETACDPARPEPLGFVKIDEPTLPCCSWSTTARLRARKANTSPRAICASGCTRKC